MRKLLLGIITLFLSINALQAQSINSNNSSIQFRVKNMKVNTVSGSISGMKGKVAFNPNNLAESKFHVSIDLNSIDTKNKKRDQHLKEEDFFNVQQFPNISFESSQISKTELGYLAKGNVTIKGISKTIEIPFRVNGKLFEGKTSINRYDFQLGKETGSFMIGEKVDIEIICEIN